MKKRMKIEVQKWGKSLVLQIPEAFVAETFLKPNTEVDLSLTEGKLVVSPVTTAKYSLQDLLESITKKNSHAEVDSGASVGNEIW